MRVGEGVFLIQTRKVVFVGREVFCGKQGSDSSVGKICIHSSAKQISTLL